MTDDNPVTPEDYPADCTISAEELRELKDALMSHEDWRSYVEEWPPTDDNGYVYPIWFTVDDLQERGELIDSRDNNYSPFAGNLEPLDPDNKDYCNTPLTNWRERYPTVRYCAVVLNKEMGYERYCHFHQGRNNVKTPEEHLQTGLFTKTIDHFYEKLSGWKKLTGWGIFESLMGESNYEFAVEYRPKEIDFTDETIVPDDVDEDGFLEVKAGYPTQHVDASLSLYVAAMMSVQMMTVQPRIMHEDREQGQGMMESKTTDKAQLTSPTEVDPSQEWMTLEKWTEHHLNLPLSRVISDRNDLLQRGGVELDPEAQSDGLSDDDVVLEIQADAETMETTDKTADPNQFGEDMTPESVKIAESASSNDDSGTDP